MADGEALLACPVFEVFFGGAHAREDPDNPKLAQTDDGPFVEANAHRPVALGSLVQRQRN